MTRYSASADVAPLDRCRRVRAMLSPALPKPPVLAHPSNMSLSSQRESEASVRDRLQGLTPVCMSPSLRLAGPRAERGQRSPGPALAEARGVSLSISKMSFAPGRPAILLARSLAQGIAAAAFACSACTVPDVVFENDAAFYDRASVPLADAFADSAGSADSMPADSMAVESMADVSCAPFCSDGVGCETAAQCASTLCRSGLCQPPTCANTPARCTNGDRCGANGDCGSQLCSEGKCLPPACAPNCMTAAPCGGKTDCVSSLKCKNGMCL